MQPLGLIHARWGNVSVIPHASGELRRLAPPVRWGCATWKGARGNLDGGQQQQQQGIRAPPPTLLKCFALPAVAAGALAVFTLSTHLLMAPVSQAQTTVDFPKAAALFQRSCIGCHDGGGNVLQPGATLFPEDLERNGVGQEDEIYNITYYGKARMPGFGEKCTPRGQCTFGPRLQDEEIELLAKFVRLQADKGWPRIESYAE